MVDRPKEETSTSSGRGTGQTAKRASNIWGLSQERQLEINQNRDPGWGGCGLGLGPQSGSAEELTGLGGESGTASTRKRGTGGQRGSKGAGTGKQLPPSCVTWGVAGLGRPGPFSAQDVGNHKKAGRANASQWKTGSLSTSGRLTQTSWRKTH